jgi:hypothetical protein
VEERLNYPCLKPFLSQNTISRKVSPFGSVLLEKPATRLPLGIKLTGFYREETGFSLTENTLLSSARAGPFDTLKLF